MILPGNCFGVLRSLFRALRTPPLDLAAEQEPRRREGDRLHSIQQIGGAGPLQIVQPQTEEQEHDKDPKTGDRQAGNRQGHGISGDWLFLLIGCDSRWQHDRICLYHCRLLLRDSSFTSLDGPDGKFRGKGCSR